MTEDEKKEFEEFLEWKAEKKRKEEENKAKQEEAERQVKVNAQMPQVEEEKAWNLITNKFLILQIIRLKATIPGKNLQPSHYRL